MISSVSVFVSSMKRVLDVEKRFLENVSEKIVISILYKTILFRNLCGEDHIFPFSPSLIPFDHMHRIS